MSYADRVITVQTVANVNEQTLISAISDVQNYPQIFPGNVKSVTVLNNKTNLVDMNAGVNGFFFNTQAVYNQTSVGTYVIEVTSGDLKGTTMTTQLNKTWGFDGKPEQGTIADISLDLKTSGFLSWVLGFVPDNSLNFALENGFARFVDYAKSI
jgi:ribosome-associated toxin RatA of RatAB toxin-antitoxin module